jgi:hypothetical protein
MPGQALQLFELQYNNTLSISFNFGNHKAFQFSFVNVNKVLSRIPILLFIIKSDVRSTQDRFPKLLNAFVLTEDRLFVRCTNLVTSVDENICFVQQLFLLFT